MEHVANAPEQHPARPGHHPSLKPWQRSWLYVAPGEIPTFAFIVAIHVFAVVGLVLLPLPHASALAIMLALMFLGGLGTTVCYHRALTHKGLKLHPVVEQVLIFFAVANGSGSPATWVANHRLHHATSDTDDDISSPKSGGFWWSHLRWLYQAGQAPLERYAKDIARPRYTFWNRAQPVVVVVSLFAGLALGPAAWLWIGPLRLVWALHAQCTINSICHLGEVSKERDSSRNVWWLTLVHMCQGENWHANHHSNQVDPRLGRGSRQVDIGWATIRVLERLGLATMVRRPLRSASAG